MTDLLSAASLLLTIVGVIYGIWYGEITSAIDNTSKLPSKEHPADRAAPLRRLRGVLCSKAIPLALASQCVSIVYLPPSLGLVVQFIHGWIRNGPAILLQYDPIGTSFIVVEFFSVSLAYLSSARAWTLWKLTSA
jgi:hypothetical protein